MNPNYKRYADRINTLIEESRRVAALEKPSIVGPYIQDHAPLHSWLIKVNNIIEVVFGSNSPHFKHLQKLTGQGVSQAYEVKSIEGLLIGALDDLENGFLLGQEFLIASEIFDSVLEEANHLLQTGHKDAAAILSRVVLEDALRRLARLEQLDDTQKATKLNDDLKKKGRYGQPQWRQIQAWLDIGNSAAHGKFDEFNSEEVKTALDGIERFISTEFRAK